MQAVVSTHCFSVRSDVRLSIPVSFSLFYPTAHLCNFLKNQLEEISLKTNEREIFESREIFQIQQIIVTCITSNTSGISMTLQLAVFSNILWRRQCFPITILMFAVLNYSLGIRNTDSLPKVP